MLTLENIAAVRGSLLTPFGSPQNLFLYGQASVTAWHFMLHMLPLCALSAVLLPLRSSGRKYSGNSKDL